MTEPAEHDPAAGRGTSAPSGTASSPASPRHVSDSLIFCLGSGAGGFGGVYWVDDRLDRPALDAVFEGSAAAQFTST